MSNSFSAPVTSEIPTFPFYLYCRVNWPAARSRQTWQRSTLPSIVLLISETQITGQFTSTTQPAVRASSRSSTNAKMVMFHRHRILLWRHSLEAQYSSLSWNSNASWRPNEGWSTDTAARNLTRCYYYKQVFNASSKIKSKSRALFWISSSLS